MNDLEINRADLWATGISPDSHPVQYVRDELAAAGVVPASGLSRLANGRLVKVAGVVTHRQRPATAAGVIFLNLEDETGLINVICNRAVWVRYRVLVRAAPALMVEGKLEKVEGVINVVAARVERLPLAPSPLRSRDFR